jgi:hypothetical protein
MTMALKGGEVSASRPGRSLPPGKTRYPLYSRLGGPQGRSGQMWKISPPPGFDPRTVQPVANRCTDYATRPTCGETDTPKIIVPHLQLTNVLKNPSQSTSTDNPSSFAIPVPLSTFIMVKHAVSIQMLCFLGEDYICMLI